ncbi:MAG: hypothetical protein K2M03_04905, partial [Muribaculaceae bacterium]|nr:hypothetical protein [Muribaculaceae bacterium]
MKILLSLSLTAISAVAAVANTANLPEQSEFIRTANTASFETDFTIAAEKTVNEVVCIKSYT